MEILQNTCRYLKFCEKFVGQLFAVGQVFAGSFTRYNGFCKLCISLLSPGWD